jgi:hypothetical protein
MSEKSDCSQSIVDENNSLRVLITVLITHYLLIESEYSKLQKENIRISREYDEYRARHPLRVGVKHGKAYELKQLDPDSNNNNLTFDTNTVKPKRIGAQKGHKRQIRKKCESFDYEVIVDFDCCPECGCHNLSNVQEVRTRYVEDIPPQRTVTTKYQIKRRYCRDCKKLVEGEVADALPHARIGIRAMLAVVWLKVGLRLTVSAIPQVLEKFCGLEICEGEVINICNQISEALGPYYDELLEEIRTSEARYMDETSWREQGKTIWMWAFVAKGVTLYKIAHSRGHEVPLEVLGENPTGVDIHDRYGAYNVLAQKTGNRPQQLCWFHILGDTKELAQIYGEEGKQIHISMKSVFTKANNFNHEGTSEDVQELISEIESIFEREFVSLKCKKFAKKMLKERDKLFTFVTNPDVEGTNNRAERAVRPYVVLRKVSGGSKSPRGTKNIEILATAIQTCRMNGSDFVDRGRDLIATSSN